MQSYPRRAKGRSEFYKDFLCRLMIPSWFARWTSMDERGLRCEIPYVNTRRFISTNEISHPHPWSSEETLHPHTHTHTHTYIAIYRSISLAPPLAIKITVFISDSTLAERLRLLRFLFYRYSSSFPRARARTMQARASFASFLLLSPFICRLTSSNQRASFVDSLFSRRYFASATLDSAPSPSSFPSARCTFSRK